MKPVTSAEGVAEAKTYMEQGTAYSPEKKKEIEDRLHRGTELKEFIKCSSCHSASGIMNFKELGFDPARINQLVKMEIGGMITNYDVFYFPQIFEEKFLQKVGIRGYDFVVLGFCIHFMFLQE